MSIHGQQSGKSSDDLILGDSVDDFQINARDLMNFEGSDLKLSQFNGKLVILDFWATFCVPCIAAIPKLEELQRKYSDKLQILMVSLEDKPTVSKFLAARKKRTGLDAPKIPFILNDSTLYKKFRIKSMPTTVWVNSKGNLQSITYGDSLTLDNLEIALNDPNYNFSFYKEAGIVLADRDTGQIRFFEKPFYGFSSPPLKNLRKFSYLSKYVEGLISGYNGCTISDVTKKGYFFMTNGFVKNFYQFAYSMLYFRMVEENVELSWIEKNKKDIEFPECRTILEVKGKEKYEYLKGQPDSVTRNNGYSYQLILEDATYRKLYDAMQADMKNYFGLTAKLQKRKMPCWVITAEDTSLIKSRGGEPYWKEWTYSLEIRNIPIADFAGYFDMNLYYLPPVVDETNYSGNVDLNIDFSSIDVNSKSQEDLEMTFNRLNLALKKYKMKVLRLDREVTCLVISDSVQ